MTYKWYNIINQDDFIAMGFSSKQLEVDLEDIGVKTVLVTKGVGVSILYDGVFLTVNLNNNNPFEFDSHAVYIDANNDIWLGVGQE
jgi:hypothetical protein